MSKERRQLEDWEKAECAALKAALAEFNRSSPKEKRLTQDELSHLLGMSQGTLSSHLNGHRALNLEMAATISGLLSVPIEKFSKRIAKEIATLSSAAASGSAEAEIEGFAANYASAAEKARTLAVNASPRSRSALEKIAEAADSGLLSEDDVMLLEVIASRLAASGSAGTESPHQRLRKKLANHDPVSK
ncbi:helix-turn-helix transcriptional regulator [Pseudomonas syringae group sp. J254-4]|uniref:helix-turn-helix domain-containing protein n=1 Tax=Pseudomonas syringae group sp. J254-4 TaxID=3079589 RepID=UPI002915187C|nr:helix-turn-helix transcriptional regulator [Pseudomonas syringae group sp. J254-4]MDU8454846.1 helix-turn-helix transcriptional regulator [Pseudomonas syringae group sp. J254-4]